MIDKIERGNLFTALGEFIIEFRAYIISFLQERAGDEWVADFERTLSNDQLRNWQKDLKRKIKPEDLIDFHHLHSFAEENKDLLKRDFPGKNQSLPTWLREIASVRHKLMHHNGIEEDEAAKTWIHLRAIVRMMSKPELEQEFLNLEKSKTTQERKINHQIDAVPDQFIESAVLRSSNLSLKLNKGEIHRIMKTGCNGSLWIYKTERRGYRVETTGEVGTRLNSEIRNFLGRDYDHETVKGYKIWFVDTADEVRRIIDIYDRI